MITVKLVGAIASLSCAGLALAQPCQESWTAMASGMSVPVQVGITPFVGAATTFDSGTGPRLYAGGHFAKCGATTVNSIARWNGTAWQSVRGGVTGGSVTVVLSLAVYDSGTGPGLYAAGIFDVAGGVAAKNIAKWNGTSWSKLGAPINGINGTVNTLAVFDDGNGPALYAGGAFSSAGGVPVSNVARWNGSQWSAVPGAFNGTVNILQAYDGALYAGGAFTAISGVTVNHIAKFDRSSWQPLGSGIGQPNNANVFDLAVMPPGTSVPPGMYVGGGFTSAGGISTENLARWNGTAWSAVPNVLTATIWSLDVHDAANLPDGGISEPALYASGNVSASQGPPPSAAARWNGMAWSILGTGAIQGSNSTIIEVLDDGSGAAAYLGGSFATIGSVTVNRFARWGYPANGTPVNVVIQPNGTTVVFGEPVSLEITVAGSNPMLQWRRNGVNLQDGGPISGSHSDVLMINPAMPSDTGAYDVVVSNDCGTIFSDAVSLEVMTCQGDVAPGFGDTAVNIDDLMLVLNAWGNCGGGDCIADVAPISGDGIVNVDDLMFIILSWGQCK